MGSLSLDGITIVWSAIFGSCATLAAINLLIWLRRPRSAGNGIFAVMAMSTGITALGEIVMMQASTPLDYALVLRWLHIPVYVSIVSVVCLVHVYFRAGRLWLGIAACAVRGGALVMNFLSGENVNFLHVEALRKVSFLGAQVDVAVGQRNPWMILSQAGLLLLLIYLLDATLEVWRRGEKWKATIAGGALFGFVAPR